MMRFGFTLAITLAALAASAPAHALNAEARLQLASEFLSKSMLLEQVTMNCHVQFPGAPLGGVGAVEQLKAHLNADEYQFFWDYLQSDAYVQDKAYTQGALQSALLQSQAKGETRDQACVHLAKTTLADYERAKAALGQLR